jgi:hypothetical protein
VFALAEFPAVPIRGRDIWPGNAPDRPRQAARDRTHRQRRQAPGVARWGGKSPNEQVAKSRLKKILQK